MNEDILTHGETMSEEQLLEGLRKTPELKRRLVMMAQAESAVRLAHDLQNANW